MLILNFIANFPFCESFCFDPRHRPSAAQFVFSVPAHIDFSTDPKQTNSVSSGPSKKCRLLISAQAWNVGSAMPAKTSGWIRSTTSTSQLHFWHRRRVHILIALRTERWMGASRCAWAGIPGDAPRSRSRQRVPEIHRSSGRGPEPVRNFSGCGRILTPTSPS
jgi:hypothetical protein